ncbi:MAG: cyclopropane-fatty-acyl-phospholipid synthase family protein [Hyphomicrobiales bacterium]
MFAALRRVLDRIVLHGSLTLIDADGKRHEFGDSSDPRITVRILKRSAYGKLASNPGFYLGRLYMDDHLLVEEGSIYDFLALCLSNIERNPASGWMEAIGKLRYPTRWIRRSNSARRTRRNIAHHYDLTSELYGLFLDADRQYSCAYFETPDTDLEVAQLAKKRHIAAKLALGPGQRVLDIGSGWGGFSLYLAAIADIEVVGLTLSEQQYHYARERARQRGLSDRVTFRLADYRTIEGRFDRIVSVGMFEHVGAAHYRAFFEKLRSSLAPDGVALLHSIARSDGPGVTNAWIAKYIFPGGYVPALSEVIPVIEKAGLYVNDIEILRLHYAKTLRHWRHRFVANRRRILQLRDQRFFKMWEFYLAASETAFRYQGMNNFQIQITHHQHVLPPVRDYMGKEEDRLRSLESQRPGLSPLAL